MPYVWPAGAATGVGSLPGTDPAEAARTVAGELPDLPHLPELPERGPGADMIGRGVALLADLHADLQPAGWRFVARPGVDARRAEDYLRWDLDALETAFAGYAGPLKLQLAGPWTLAASVELTRGDRALSDKGAVADIAGALREGVAEHVADVRRRVPGADVVVQLDEPSLPFVAAGRVPTASGFGAIAAVGEHELLDTLRAATPDGVPVGLHCCAAHVPLRLLLRYAPAFVSLDATLVRDYDTLAELVESGVHLLLGTPDVATAQDLWRKLSHPPEMLGERVTVTPACGLAGLSPDAARAALTRAREIAQRLQEDV